MNFDLKLRIPDGQIGDMIEQCKLTSAPEPSLPLGNNIHVAEESESNYVPDTDQEDVECVTESQFVKFMKKFK